jgi:plastocyanin
MPRCYAKTRRTSPMPPLVAVVWVASLLAGLSVAGLAAASTLPAVVRPSSSVEFVNISTTTSFSYDPAQFTVVPGDTVELTVTQLSTTNHTFVLSPIANFSFVSSNTTGDLVHFFEAHHPLVNLSLPGTVGATAKATFTAPAAGTYEYVCVIKDHFAGGMHGVMVSASPTSSSPGTASTTLYIGVGVVVLIIIVAVAALMMRRRPKSPAPAGGSPGSP